MPEIRADWAMLAVDRTEQKIRAINVFIFWFLNSVNNFTWGYTTWTDCGVAICLGGVVTKLIFWSPAAEHYSTPVVSLTCTASKKSTCSFCIVFKVPLGVGV
jgi:hypothetical protein